MTRVALATVTGLVVVGGLLAGCSGSDGNPTAGSGTSATTGAQPSGTSTTSPPASSSSSKSSTTSAPAAGASGSPSTVPSKSVTTRPVVPITGTGTFAPGATVTVVKRTPVKVTGKGPGELSGSGVAFTLRFANTTGKTLDLGDAVVTASVTDGDPANESSSAPASPWKGTVKAGGTKDGTYVFLMSGKDKDKVTLYVTYDPEQPVVRLRGRASS